jgi:hypothetical protein
MLHAADVDLTLGLWHTSLLDNDLIKAEFLGGTFKDFFFNGILIRERERDEVTNMYLLL